MTVRLSGAGTCSGGHHCRLRFAYVDVRKASVELCPKTIK
jgi:hypothetical protein